MRVLHCIYDDPANPWVAGGGAVRVREIYRRLVPQLDSVVVATGGFPGSREETIDGIQYRRLGAARPYPWSRLSYSFAASRLLARGGYDAAVYDFSTYTPLRLPPHRPVGVTVHHVTGENAAERWGRAVGGLLKAQEKARLRRARILSATSRETERLLRQIVGPSVEIVPIKAGVPDGLFEQPHRDDGYLLYFGRVDWHHKGLDVLLEAMSRIVAERPDTALRIAGRGKDAARTEAEIARLRLGSRVEMLGPVDDRKRDDLFAGASLLLMPSRFEGFGMVAAEAMAAGLPVVASDAGSLPEVVDPPAGGAVFPSGDAEALAETVLGLLGDPERREALSRSARESASRFRWDRIAGEHLDFLKRISNLDAGSSRRDD